MVKIRTMNNGIRVVLEELPYVRSVSFGIWVGSGSRRETPAENGASHFIEHMLFKGTETRSAKDIAEEMDAIGGHINAYTTKEYTCFHTRVLDKHLDRAMKVMSDMFLHSKFAPEEIQKERNVILEEITMYDDTPEDLVHEQLQNEIWRGCGLGQPILGRAESLAGFTRGSLADYMSRYYRPENTVIALAGSFTEAQVMEQLTSYFGGWRHTGQGASPGRPTVYTTSVVKTQKDVEQLHLCLGFPAFARDHRLKYAVSVFNTLFGGGMSSRLFQNIREEKGLTYSIYSYISVFEDAGLFGIYAGMSPGQIEEVMDLIQKEIAAVKAEGIPEGLLQKTKEQIISNFIISSESTANRMSANGGSVLMRGYVQNQESILSAIEAVSRADVDEVMETILNPGKMSLSAVGGESALLECVKF